MSLNQELKTYTIPEVKSDRQAKQIEEQRAKGPGVFGGARVRRKALAEKFLHQFSHLSVCSPDYMIP